MYYQRALTTSPSSAWKKIKKGWAFDLAEPLMHALDGAVHVVRLPHLIQPHFILFFSFHSHFLKIFLIFFFDFLIVIEPYTVHRTLSDLCVYFLRNSTPALHVAETRSSARCVTRFTRLLPPPPPPHPTYTSPASRTRAPSHAYTHPSPAPGPTRTISTTSTPPAVPVPVPTPTPTRPTNTNTTSSRASPSTGPPAAGSDPLPFATAHHSRSLRD